jgi:hypothetical protein
MSPLFGGHFDDARREGEAGSREAEDGFREAPVIAAL